MVQTTTPINIGALSESPNTQSDAPKAARSHRLDYETRTGWNDVLWLILFAVHIIFVVFLAVAFGPSFIERAKNTPRKDLDNPGQQLKDNIGNIAGLLVVAVVAGIATATAWLAIAKRYADRIIKFSIGFMIATNVLCFLQSALAGSPLQGLIFLVFAGITALYFYFVRNRTRFAGVMLELSVNVIQDYSGPVYIAFVFVVLQVAWVIFWFFTFMAVFDSIEENNPAAFLLIISFYWTVEVLKNIVHVTTAGVAATWWFFAEPRSPTSKSLKRATTTSLGSICFGSLLVAILSAIRELVRAAAKGDRSFVAVCARCILACVEEIIKYFNVYAFSRVAIYGTSFWQSGKETCELFISRGFDVIVNDDLTGTVLALGAFVGFVISGGVSLAWGSALDIPKPVVFAVIGGLIGYVMVALVMSVLRSCVATFFITWAEEPSALQQTRPDMYLKLRDAVHRMYPDLQSEV